MKSSISTVTIWITIYSTICHILCYNTAHGLVYPFSDLDVLRPASALIPSLPRPMYSRADSPFKIFGTSAPYIRASFVAALEQPAQSTQPEKEGSEYFGSVFLITFTSDNDMEREEVFDFGYKYVGLDSISTDLCFVDDTQKLQKSISPTVRALQKVAVHAEPINGGNAYLVEVKAAVETTGFQYAFLANCNVDSDQVLHVSTGKFMFKNPHGYLPGGWYLKLPFSGAISLGYFTFLTVFLVRCLIYRKDVLYIQYGLVAVMMMGLIEQASYYFTFLKMNVVGDLPCCPVRTDMGFCLVLSAVKRAFLIIFLLAVSIGYGIQKPSMTRREIISVSVMGILYLFAAVNYEISLIEEIDSLTEDEDSDANKAYVAFPQMMSSLFLTLLNMVVVSWIYFSTISVIEQLKADKQEAKQKMYETLARALMLWFVVGFIAEILFYIYLSDTVSMPWKYELVPKFIWDALFFMVIVQIGWIWFPSSVTSQYAYSTQLPQFDFDDTGGDVDSEDMFSDKLRPEDADYDEFENGNGVEEEFDRLAAADSDDNDTKDIQKA